MLIKEDDRPIHIICKACGSVLRNQGVCGCGNVSAFQDKYGAIHIEELDDSAVIDAE